MEISFEGENLPNSEDLKYEKNNNVFKDSYFIYSYWINRNKTVAYRRLEKKGNKIYSIPNENDIYCYLGQYSFSFVYGHQYKSKQHKYFPVKFTIKIYGEEVYTNNDAKEAIYIDIKKDLKTGKVIVNDVDDKVFESKKFQIK